MAPMNSTSSCLPAPAPADDSVVAARCPAGAGCMIFSADAAPAGSLAKLFSADGEGREALKKLFSSMGEAAERLKKLFFWNEAAADDPRTADFGRNEAAYMEIGERGAGGWAAGIAAGQPLRMRGVAAASRGAAGDATAQSAPPLSIRTRHEEICQMLGTQPRSGKGKLGRAVTEGRLGDRETWRCGDKETGREGGWKAARMMKGRFLCAAACVTSRMGLSEGLCGGCLMPRCRG